MVRAVAAVVVAAAVCGAVCAEPARGAAALEASYSFCSLLCVPPAKECNIKRCLLRGGTPVVPRRPVGVSIDGFLIERGRKRGRE